MKWGGRRKRMTTAQRRDYYVDACGENEYPTCNLCSFPIMPGQAWDVSHEGAPQALGGSKTGIAHRRCNAKDGAENVTPRVAWAKRQFDKHRGIAVSRNPVPGGRDDPWKRTMDGRVIDRVTGEPWGTKRKD